jgi:hypothetical protein
MMGRDVLSKTGLIKTVWHVAEVDVKGFSAEQYLGHALSKEEAQASSFTGP